MKPFLSLKSVDEILAMIWGASRLSPINMPLDEAAGLRLAEDFVAPADLPGFARSTVDGYAVAARDLFGASEGAPALLRLVGDCDMGVAPHLRVLPGTAAGILTGGMLPEGADCAVMVEYSRQAGPDWVEIIKPQAPGDNIVGKDEDARAGQTLIPAGRRLRPQETGALAAFGIAEVSVTRRARVAIISTGDEVVPVDANPGPGQVRDVNAHSLASLCREELAIPQLLGICRDNRKDLEEMISKGMDSDVIVVSGGSSAGMRDHTVAAFLKQPDARLLAHGAAISPGKPFIMAVSCKKYLLGLPGHVVSALICGRVFLCPLLRRLQGALSPAPVPVCEAALTRPVASAQGRRDYIRCRLISTPQGYEAEPILLPSAVISGLVAADGLIVCPENSEGLYAGQKVSVQLLQ